MNVLRDQRTMIGPDRHRSVDDIETAWRAWVETPGIVLAHRVRRGDLSTDLRESDAVVVAYVSGGKWVADCPICNGGIAVWIDNPRGCCLDCGTIFRVDHPSEEDAARADEILAARPDPGSRSWHRHLGETLDHLADENETMIARDRAARDAASLVRLDDVERILGSKAASQLRERVG